MDELQFLEAQLKETFGEVFRIGVEDDTYYARLLTRKEYKGILMLTNDKGFQDELVCQLAVVYPEGIKFSEFLAGLPQTLAPIIVNESGFGNLKKANIYFDAYQAEMDTSFERQAEAVIQAAFPQISDEEMEDWDVNKFMKMTAKAEWLLRNVKGYAFEFQRTDEVEDEIYEEPELPSAKELGNELRQEGRDPMIEFAPFIIKPRPYAEFPFIAGTEHWKRVSE